MMVLRKARLGDPEFDFTPVSGADALSLTTRLTIGVRGGVEDFASYDGVLQLGVPPRRIDIINRADGISFAEAIAEGATFEIEGCAIPVIGRGALIKNKRAAGPPQDLADVKTLDVR
jgi:hypothetical protein